MSMKIWSIFCIISSFKNGTASNFATGIIRVEIENVISIVIMIIPSVLIFCMIRPQLHLLRIILDIQSIQELLFFSFFIHLEHQ